MRTALALVGGGLVAALLTAVVVEIVRRWSLRFALLDRPNHRSSHVVPTPRLGGIGVALTVLAGLTAVAASAVAAPSDARRLLLVVVIGAVVSVVSLVDDVWALNAPVRLLVHLVAGAAVVFGIGPVATIDGGALGSVTLPGVVAPWLTVLWVAWFINAFNFMDGSDGIAARRPRSPP